MGLRGTMGAAAAFAALALAGCGEREAVEDKGKKAPLLCHVGGTMRPALEAIAKLYETETGQAVKFNFADSGTLMIQIEQSKRGDLYVCHDPFGGGAEKKGLADRIFTVAALTPVIVVQKGNPKGITGLRDLAKPGLRLGLTDERYSTLGHINPLMFERAGLRKEIEANVVTRTRMGAEVANAVGIGTLDAATVWNAVAWVRSDKLDAIPIEPAYHLRPGVDAVTTATYGVIDMGTVKVTVVTLKCSRQLEAARAFAEFIASPRGRKVFADFGFSPAPDGAAAPPAEPKAAAGTLHLFCGAGIRPPVAEAIEAFEKQTGKKVRADYAGSGTLLSNIRAANRGDLYMPGESEYLDRAAEFGLVASRRDICYFIPVILVAKGNPKGIKSLQDLTQPGLRLGLGNPETAAIGQVCAKLFEKNAIPREAIKANTRVETLTVNELGLMVKIGQLDATIVWDAIAAYYRDSAEAIPIPLAQNVVSRVAIAVLKTSGNPEAAQAFVDFLASEAGQAIFRKHNYTISLPSE